MINLPVLVLGAGGHAKVVADTLLSSGAKVLGFTDPEASLHGKKILGLPVLGTDDIVRNYQVEEVLLANGLGSVGSTRLRTALFFRLQSAGYHFATVIHPTATISVSAVLGEGCQVMSGAIIQPECKIGVNCIINTKASLDHECRLAGHVHIAPGVTVSGGVAIGEGAHVGTGAVIVQGVRIGTESLIAAGSVVIRDVPDRARVCGVPASSMDKTIGSKLTFNCTNER